MVRSDATLAGRLPELLAAVAVVVPGLLLTTVAATTVTVLAALLPGSAAGIAEIAFVGVVGVGVVGTVLAAAATWVAVGRLRRATRSRIAERKVDLFRRSSHLEALVPPLRRFGLSSRFRPDEDAGVEVLRRRYVEGGLDEHEFERELERLLGGDSPAGRRPDGLEAPDSTDLETTERGLDPEVGTERGLDRDAEVDG
ncbi:hypothetical protein BRC81_04100 [Halobacteriales archaeon QS_1_68_20]|nr:MAG: hypothetical protein BRC81_04100 [Halobacteriales archaeon QS_1_68_20]